MHNIDRETAMRRQMRFHMLSTAPPTYVAEVVANHYLSMAVSAQQLLKLIELHRARPSLQTEEFIKMQLDAFKTQHREKLGLELAWGEDPADDPANGLAANLQRMLDAYGPPTATAPTIVSDEFGKEYAVYPPAGPSLPPRRSGNTEAPKERPDSRALKGLSEVLQNYPTLLDPQRRGPDSLQLPPQYGLAPSPGDIPAVERVKGAGHVGGQNPFAEQDG